MYNYGYANNCRCNRCPHVNTFSRCNCGFNRCNCGLNNCYDSDILTFLLLRQLIRNMNCCCRVSPYA